MSISGGAASDLQFVCSVGMNNTLLNLDFCIIFLHLRYVSGRPLLLGLHQEGWAFEPPSPALYSPCAGRSRGASVAGLKCSGSFSDLVETWFPSLQRDLLPSPSTCVSHCQCGCSAMLESSQKSVDKIAMSTLFLEQATRAHCYWSSLQFGLRFGDSLERGRAAPGPGKGSLNLRSLLSEVRDCPMPIFWRVDELNGGAGRISPENIHSLSIASRYG